MGCEERHTLSPSQMGHRPGSRAELAALREELYRLSYGWCGLLNKDEGQMELFFVLLVLLAITRAFGELAERTASRCS